MEIPSQQPTDHVLTAARATSLLRRHFSLRGQDSESAQGKQRHVLTFPRVALFVTCSDEPSNFREFIGTTWKIISCDA